MVSTAGRVCKMACVEKRQPMEVEREEGEIIDDLDDLSDISSEEEFLLRQRLQVLENYNNVLERKEAKRSSIPTPGNKAKRKDSDIQDLSDVSLSNFDDVFHPRAKITKLKNASQYKHKKRKEVVNQENIFCNFGRDKRKFKTKKKLPLKVISESSEESDQEDKSKRIKLATAISVSNKRTDSSLQSRLMNMLCGNKVNSSLTFSSTKENNIDAAKELLIKETEKLNSKKALETHDKIKNMSDSVILIDDSIEAYKKIHLSSDAKNCKVTDFNSMDLATKSPSYNGSDDDLEMLRNFALQSKTQKSQETKKVPDTDESEFKIASEIIDSENDIITDNLNTKIVEKSKKPTEPELKSEDEDSDTTELRLICLRSTLLKKAIEMKQKKKMRKRLSQSTSLYDDIIAADIEQSSKDKENNTDTESVDMEIGSDHEKEQGQNPTNNIIEENENSQEKIDVIPKADDFEEDEDLLRAQLLTSLSKNLPLLVDVNNLNESVEDIETNEKANIAAHAEEKNAPQEQRFIINTADSDSEGEHEATKNLTKMHMKLSDSVEFQQRLDSFLKLTRLEVEGKKLPDVVQTNTAPPPVTDPPKTPEKFVPKAVNHLPKTEQIEYQNLVKRMAELEKMRQARQVVLNTGHKPHFPGAYERDTLKSRNVTFDPHKTLPPFNNFNSNIDEDIALSRRKIAEESAKVLKLKEEGFNLSQKYKIVATELRNLATAITFNKKSQKTAQIKLSKIRAQHHILLKRSTDYTKSNPNVHILKRTVENTPLLNFQKENAPIKSNVSERDLKSVKVSVVNDLPKKIPEDFSIQVDVSSNKKTIKVPSQTSPVKNATEHNGDVKTRLSDTGQPKEGNKETEMEVYCIGNNDYESPLLALKSANWDEDPHGVLCPFVVDGSCKDHNCRYLHPKTFPDP